MSKEERRMQKKKAKKKRAKTKSKSSIERRLSGTSPGYAFDDVAMLAPYPGWECDYYRSRDICFKCKKRGHWAQDCPMKW